MALAQEIGDRGGEARAITGISAAHSTLGKYEKSIEFTKEALVINRELGNDTAISLNLISLGAAYGNLGEYEESIFYSRQALIVGRKTQSRNEEFFALKNLGVAFKELGQTDTAISFFKQAINIIESIRRDNIHIDQSLQEVYIDKHDKSYRQLADLLLTQGKVLEAQKVLDLLAIEEIQDYNQNTRSTVLPSGEIDYTETETKIRDRHNTLVKVGLEILRCEVPNSGCRAQLPDLREQRRKLVIQFNQLTKAINQQSIARQAQEDGVQLIAGLNNSARKLVEQKDNTLFVYTFINIDPKDPRKGTLWLIWVGPGGVVNTIDREINPKELANTALKFRRLLTSSRPYDATEFQTLSQQLHWWIIDPLQDELEKNNIQHLVFRLDRELRYIPMAALHNGDSFLIERYTVANGFCRKKVER